MMPFNSEQALIHKKEQSNVLNYLFMLTKKRKLFSFLFAEREGFEPPVPFSTSVFKTGAIDHSATSPKFLNIKRGRFV